MRPRTALFGALGALATAFGVGLLLVPDLLLALGPVDASVSVAAQLETTVVALLAGGILLLALGVLVRTPAQEGPTDTQSSATPRFEHASTVPPAETTQTTAVTAAGIESDVQDAATNGGDAYHEVLVLLYETAASAHAERTGVAIQDAKAAVDAGTWTADPVATVTLAGADGPTPPLTMRLRFWLVPTRERTRRIERTVAAIEGVTQR